MKDTNFGTYNEGGMQHCKKCNHILEFPPTSNLYMKTAEIIRKKEKRNGNELK